MNRDLEKKFEEIRYDVTKASLEDVDGLLNYYGNTFYIIELFGN